MGYSRDVYNEAMLNIFKRRQKAEALAQAHQDEIYKQLPRAQEINRELVSCSVGAARAVFSGADVKTQLKSLADKSIALQSELAALLTDNGYEADYLEVHYTCKKCHDHGLIDIDGATVDCDCIKKMMCACACEKINRLSPLSLSTFGSFSLDFYPYDSSSDGVSPYSRMSKILNFCKNYAKNFSPQSRSILMRGATGLGKTHLSLAIANEVLKSGFSVVYVSAPTILSKLEKEHFSYKYQSEEDTLSTLSECDLLIIDDLGTEFSTQFSQAEIYNIFNNRILIGKPVIINTNMTVKELETTYSQRFVSRIIGSCDKLDFAGRDVRAMKTE